MSALNHFLKNTVAAFFAIVWISLPLGAVEEARLARLLGELKQAESVEAHKIAREIELELSKSGSSAMDMLLKRGRDALERGETQVAIEHLTALTDHAPDFAEGWHMRAVAYTKAGLYGPALADLERALSLQPQHFEAIFGLGIILEELDRPELAHEAYSRVMDIHPNHEHVAAALERLEGAARGQDL